METGQDTLVTVRKASGERITVTGSSKDALFNFSTDPGLTLLSMGQKDREPGSPGIATSAAGLASASEETVYEAYEDNEDTKYVIEEEEEENEFDDSNALICSCTLGNSSVLIQTKDEKDLKLCGKEVITKNEEEEEEVEAVEPVQSTLIINLKNSGFTDGATPRIKIMDHDPKDDLETKEAKNEDMEKEEIVVKPKKSLLQKILNCFICFQKPKIKS